jgi:hypothetical protein
VRVSKADWPSFAHFHKSTSDDSCFTTQDAATSGLSVPQLNELWSYLVGTQTLGDVATASRGIEWNIPLIGEDRKETGNRQRLVLDEPIPGETREGVPPGAKISLFQKPDTKHLIMRSEDQRGKAYKLPWNLPKVILNKARRSRGPWRISAFADFDQLTCYQTFIAVWPHDPAITTALAATLNGPVANAFFFTKKEGLDVTIAIIKELPMPTLSESQRAAIETAVSTYLRAVESGNWEDANASLLQIDALVLKGYDLPPKLERKLLDFFRGCGHSRQVPFAFGDYFPPDFEPSFSLLEYLSDELRLSTAGTFRARKRDVPDNILEAMKQAVESYDVE